LRFFALQGRQVAPMGVKFGTEEGHTHRCNDKGIGLPKLKFLLEFDQNVEYKCFAGAYPLHDFHKICRVCTAFQIALAVKILLDLLKGLWSYWGFWVDGVSLHPSFQRPVAVKLCVRPQKFWICKNVLKVLYRHAKFGARISPAAGAAKNVSFLSVCLFVTLPWLCLPPRKLLGGASVAAA